MLSQFRKVSIIWDGVNERISERINLVVGGGGRLLTVTVINNGQTIDTDGIDLALKWKSGNGLYSGRDVFERTKNEAGTYSLVPPKDMVRNTGVIRATFELSAKDEEPVTSLPFDIHVKEAI